jgi:hypothetical protein
MGIAVRFRFPDNRVKHLIYEYFENIVKSSVGIRSGWPGLFKFGSARMGLGLAGWSERARTYSG